MNSGPSVAIIGAGIGGICLALDLQKQGLNDYTIYEMETGIGGTWYQNRYPGCRCDVPAILYSHSQFQNPNWSQTHPPRQELLEYWQELAKAQGIDRHVKLRHRFVSAVWDEATKMYTVTVHDDEKDVDVVTTVNVLVSAIGAFAHPKTPKLKGQDLYHGLLVHAARWPFDLDPVTFRGKTVAVVGNGCAGAQIVSTLSEDPEIKVVAIARSPHWYIPNGQDPTGRVRNSVPYSEGHKKLWNNYPIVQHVSRALTYLAMDSRWIIFPLKNKWLNDLNRKKVEKWQRESLPEEYKANGVPDFPLGAKRFVIEDGYLGALNKPNVKAVWGGLTGLTEAGVEITDGRTFDADVVVFASGFDIEANGLDIRGSESKVRDFAHASDIPQYHGMATPGIPNFFTLLGSFSAPGHSSVVFILESQAKYIMQLIKAMRDDHIPRLDIKRTAATKWIADTQRRADKTVWTKAKSYMRANGGNGRVWTHYPGHLSSLWWENLYPVWSHWSGAEKLSVRQRARKGVFILALLAAAGFGLTSTATGVALLHTLFPGFTVAHPTAWTPAALAGATWENVTTGVVSLCTGITSLVM